MDSLRTTLQPLLQPVTHNLPAPIRDLGVSLLGDTCYTSLVLDIDVADAACLKLAVSKALGIGIVGASSVVKVPQILNLVRSRSASGVSFLSYLLETTSYLISLAYNVRNGFPFSTYGETALILGQNIVITVLVLNYSGRAGVAALFAAVLAAAAATLFTGGAVDMAALGYLQAGAGALGVASKVPQIAAIWQEGGTGQLSAFTVSSTSGIPPTSCCAPTIFATRFLDFTCLRCFICTSLSRPGLGVRRSVCKAPNACPHAFPRSMSRRYAASHLGRRGTQKTDLLFRAGLQLPGGLRRPHLHDVPGGGRQADFVRLRGGLRAQLRASGADAVLLERALGQGAWQAQGEGHHRRHPACCIVVFPVRRWGVDRRHGRGCSQEGADDTQARLGEK